MSTHHFQLDFVIGSSKDQKYRWVANALVFLKGRFISAWRMSQHCLQDRSNNHWDVLSLHIYISPWIFFLSKPFLSLLNGAILKDPFREQFYLGSPLIIRVFYGNVNVTKLNLVCVMILKDCPGLCFFWVIF